MCCAGGFSVKMGFGLGAEVDDIEGEVDFGPFGFTLDPLPPPEEKEEKVEAASVCVEFCDQVSCRINNRNAAMLV